jgi:hypothetical protein
MRWHKHLMTWSNIRGDHGKVKGRSTTIDADCMRNTQKVRDLAFERIDLGT